MKNLPVISALALVFLGAASAASAMPVGDPAPIRLAELADLSLEQLANVTVTSASRHEERAIEAPASIFVLTAEDIRRSGATSLPELLRLAPNLQVIRGDTSQYIVSARGGLSGTANKMLVLVDGRTIYTPLFSGVFYDAQVLMLEDLERVEVISGPGSTLWGTNAVNGVINIVTKPAARTQGALLAAGAGDMEKGVSARAGAPFTDGHYRVYGRYFERAAHERAGGLTAFDQAERWQAGFRADWERGGRTTTVQGDLYGAKVDNLGGARDMAGGNLLGRWRIPTGADGDVMVQAFYDRTEREHEGSFREKRDTFDVEVQRSLRRARHEMVLGAGYRAST
ncbi:MAG TPA: TonB-dependent receptor plug domain-containing protein, partial [Usitatibacter sp.]|nr:TonB-dependent receptor plug domain-containing protein [Usitatibacter sp.]